MIYNLFFAANNGTTGVEPYVLNGVDGTITPLGDLVSGPGSSVQISGGGVAVDDAVYFAARSEDDGVEPFITDGTVAGTRKILDLNIGGNGSGPKEFVRVGDEVFFGAYTPGVGHEPFRTNGTEDGTRIIADINDGPASSISLFESFGSIEFNGKLLLAVSDPAFGRVPYITDGTISGTMSLVDDVGFREFTIGFFGAVIGDRAYFTMDDQVHGYELWETDGTVDGTKMVRDIQPGYSGSNIRDMAVLNGALLLSASGPLNRDEDSDGEPDPGGHELWVSDGTEAGTVLLKDIEPDTTLDGSGPGNFTVLGDKVVFTASTISSGEGLALWRTDGTEAGTRMIADLLPDDNLRGYFSDFTPFGDGSRAMFIAASDAGKELWITDGTATGTRLVKDIDQTTSDWIGSPTPGNLTAVGDLVYFTADDGVHGEELWVSDGTTAGTRMVEDLNPGAAGSEPDVLVPFGAAGNTPPFFVGIQGGTIREDAAIGQIVGRFVVTDDDGDPITLSLIEDAGGRFELRGDTLFLSGPVDHEVQSSHEILIDASDGEATTRAGFTIDIRDVFEGIGSLGNDELRGTEGEDNLRGGDGDDVLNGGRGADDLSGEQGSDRLLGEEGDDTLDGGAGTDTLNGGEGNDSLIGGSDSADLRDVIYAGAGNDSVDAGAGNDLVYGQDGNDTIAGGAGLDELQGQDGNDIITGSNFSDLVFGGAGDDFVNGGFGHDRINGGSGADRFFHVGEEGHGSDWVQDYAAAEGDVLFWGGGPATVEDFQVNFAHTANAAGERSGDDAVLEAFVIYKSTEQIIWALVDGGGQSSINIQIGGDTFDLLA